MIWLNPWGWLGLLGVALPVLIHLLGRGHARVYRFPTLRFVEASRLMPTRRTRIHDAALLAVRVGIIVAATAALAQPLLLTANRKRSLDRGLARAIIVDTSASVRPMLDSARRAAASLASQAQASVITQTADPAGAFDGAAAWIARQGRRGEIFVVSDFQRGQIEARDFAGVPKTIGLATHRIGVPRVAREGGRAEFDPRAIVTLAADSEQFALQSARLAAATMPVRAPIDTTRAIAIVFPRAPERASIQAKLRPVSQPWMAGLLERLADDSASVSVAGEAEVDGRNRLALLTMAQPGSLRSARLIADAMGALSGAPPTRELEPSALDDATIAGWQRPAADAPTQLHPTDPNAPTDAKWLWGLALVLLLLESRIRRAGPAATATAEAPARAA